MSSVMCTAGVAAPSTPGVVHVAGEPHMRDAKGRLVPVASVKVADRVQDDMVRRMIAKAQAVSAAIAAFREEAFAEGDALQALLDERYGVKVGGDKGNVSYMTFDGCMRMQVAVADVLSFGPELQSAKALVDECLVEWGEGTHPVLRSLIRESFDTDKEGRLNRSAIFRLLRQECADERWVRAMDAIRDSIRSTGSRQYVRFHVRPDPKAAWIAISLDAATAQV